MVKRGPQLVQFVNGYRYRRLAGSKISARQSAHVGRSGGIETRRPPISRLSTMTKSAAGSVGMGVQARSRIRAAGGAEPCSNPTKASSARGDPKASMVTPRESLETRPATPCCRARRYTQGRKPTPCTVPRTSMRRPSRSAAVTAPPTAGRRPDPTSVLRRAPSRKASPCPARPPGSRRTSGGATSCGAATGR